MTKGHIAVIDIGKTNAKLALVRRSDLAEVSVITRPNAVRPGPPYPHFDVEGHWEFILDGLARFHSELGVSSITITTHGASAALIAKDGSLAAPILDYEHKGPEDLSTTYEALRPPFAETGSPRLAMGLNLGAQLHWQFAMFPELLEKVHKIVTYPQFWAHRLTGAFATDVTSLGCHTDLWNPYEGQFSSLPEALGISRKIAEPRKPGDVLGRILPEIAARTGLAADTPVHCGIHDSNASLLPHLLRHEPPLTVVSTGTWVIAMAVGTAPVTLDPNRDTLLNVNAKSEAVPSARFMGGREYELALGTEVAIATSGDIEQVLSDKTMLLPALIPETGPFARAKSTWVGTEPPLASGKRSAAVAFYLALVTKRCLELIGSQGPILVEGPFSRSTAYLQMLSAVTDVTVSSMESETGTSEGAAHLCVDSEIVFRKGTVVPAPNEDILAMLRSYAEAWNSRASEK